MKNLALFLSLFFVSCATPNSTPKESAAEIARVTFYCAAEDKKWKSKVADPSVKKATHGETVAACSSTPFGTKVEIPLLRGIVGDGKFTVQDRGTAVSARKASGGKFPVIDVYVRSKSEMAKLSKSLPHYMQVLIN